MDLTVKDVSQLLMVAEKTVYRWIHQGAIPTLKVQGRYRFSRAELLAWASSKRLGTINEAFHEPKSADQPLPTLSEALEGGGIIYRIGGENREEVLANAVRHLRLAEDVDRQQLWQALLAREQLASTAVGHGIAIPHPRDTGLTNSVRATVTLCFLEQAIDYHALDGHAVRTLLILLSPNLRTHLHLLARLGILLQEAVIQDVLQAQDNRERIFTALASVEAHLKGCREPVD